MGFLQTIKNKLGIGGVKVELVVPGTVDKTATSITGKVNLTSKSEQELVSLKVTLIEEYSTGRGDDKKTTTLTLGQFDLSLGGAKIKPGETITHNFDLPFSLVKSSNQSLAEKGGALGAIGKLGSFANNEKSAYFVKAEADVKSAALDPDDKKPIRIV
ncbi:sporulation protein [Flavobacterium sp. RHBU_24]|uniref:sporulation protein n=1 Tax=Flavobacterium sp. RHBU_24 TaxID=3391185 RepID=UPI003985209E